MRVPVVGGNWKSYNDPKKVGQLISDLSHIKFPADVETIVAPTYLYLDQAKNTLKNVQVSAQNCSATSDGAYTGEISAAGLKEFGVNVVILGHSERRSLFLENDMTVGTKVTKALDAGLKVIACVGETLEERNSNTLYDVIARQMSAIVAGVQASAEKSFTNVIIAYEPVWAIGTGVVATPEQAQDIHEYIRKWLSDNVSAEVADQMRIMYGGSVKPSNAKELIQKQDIDGFLVGGASLVANDFLAITTACSKL